MFPKSRAADYIWSNISRQIRHVQRWIQTFLLERPPPPKTDTQKSSPQKNWRNERWLAWWFFRPPVEKNMLLKFRNHIPKVWDASSGNRSNHHLYYRLGCVTVGFHTCWFLWFLWDDLINVGKYVPYLDPMAGVKMIVPILTSNFFLGDPPLLPVVR